MSHDFIPKLTDGFDSILQVEEEIKFEFWYARDLQKVFGYSQWKNFVNVIENANTSCSTFSMNMDEHFAYGTRYVFFESN